MLETLNNELKMFQQEVESDGYSMSLNDLNNIHTPYGSQVIENLHCVNHIHKHGKNSSYILPYFSPYNFFFGVSCCRSVHQGIHFDSACRKQLMDHTILNLHSPI